MEHKDHTLKREKTEDYFIIFLMNLTPIPIAIIIPKTPRRAGNSIAIYPRTFVEMLLTPLCKAFDIAVSESVGSAAETKILAQSAAEETTELTAEARTSDLLLLTKPLTLAIAFFSMVLTPFQ